MYIQVYVLSYNRPNYLKEAVSSIVAQDYKKIKIKVLDNCSDFDVNSLLKDFKNIEIYSQIKNLGPTGQTDFATRDCKEEYCMFFHDDDTMPSNMISNMMTIHKSDNFSWVGTNYNLIKNHLNMNNYYFNSYLDTSIYINDYELVKSFSHNKRSGFASIIYKTSFLRQVINHTDWTELHKIYGQTSDVAIKILLSRIEKCAVINNQKYNVRLHENQDSYDTSWNFKYDINEYLLFQETIKTNNSFYLLVWSRIWLFARFLNNNKRQPLNNLLKEVFKDNFFAGVIAIQFYPLVAIRSLLLKPVKNFFLNLIN